MGKKKIEIRKIEELSSRQVTFSKRRQGLFKKAADFCTLLGGSGSTHMAIVVFSPGGKAFAFAHPASSPAAAAADADADAADRVVNRFLHPERHRPSASLAAPVADRTSCRDRCRVDRVADPTTRTVDELQRLVDDLDELERRLRSSHAQLTRLA